MGPMTFLTRKPSTIAWNIFLHVAKEDASLSTVIYSSSEHAITPSLGWWEQSSPRQQREDQMLALHDEHGNQGLLRIGNFIALRTNDTVLTRRRRSASQTCSDVLNFLECSLLLACLPSSPSLRAWLLSILCMLLYKGTCPSINLIPARMKSAAFLRMGDANVVPASSIPMTEDSNECNSERRSAVGNARCRPFRVSGCSPDAV